MKKQMSVRYVPRKDKVNDKIDYIVRKCAKYGWQFDNTKGNCYKIVTNKSVLEFTTYNDCINALDLLVEDKRDSSFDSINNKICKKLEDIAFSANFAKTQFEAQPDMLNIAELVDEVEILKGLKEVRDAKKKNKQISFYDEGEDFITEGIKENVW